MYDIEQQVAHVVARTLEHELQLVREAIAMVASGGAPRVVLVGINFDETLLDPARSLALEACVRLVLVSRGDELGADIAIERIRP